ncbi:hypothetical protein EHZ47_02355 [Aeromonas jandaei]|uniref:hypothetical protein n=1 Tax=Aeromonas jandaei TaxID=650 RepID=UPI000F52EBA2|nr:hypothetical protein [Aeromonas jandaei]RQM78010.1 hypothetical protein EHZ47_02355 [Aeromonas jandaei]
MGNISSISIRKVKEEGVDGKISFKYEVLINGCATEFKYDSWEEAAAKVMQIIMDNELSDSDKKEIENIDVCLNKKGRSKNNGGSDLEP